MCVRWGWGGTWGEVVRGARLEAERGGEKWAGIGRKEGELGGKAEVRAKGHTAKGEGGLA